MEPIPAPGRSADLRSERLRLLGFAGLVLVAGAGLGVAAGPPRLPAGVPPFEQVRAVLSGSTLPVDALVLVVVDLAWLMWLWIVGSLALELVVATAEAAAHGATW